MSAVSSMLRPVHPELVEGRALVEAERRSHAGVHGEQRRMRRSGLVFSMSETGLRKECGARAPTQVASQMRLFVVITGIP
jgi:hypothetical protein